MVNVGRRNAYARLAHLLCELFVKMRALGIAKEQSYTFPMTQAEIGDATGLSTVHVNRTLQELRDDGFIRTVGREMIIENWEGLQVVGEFDPRYCT